MIYKLRAECLSDVVEFIRKEQNHLINFNTQKDGIFPDYDLEFETELDLDQIILKLREIEDSHVMYQTVKPIAEYTGQRDYDL